MTSSAIVSWHVQVATTDSVISSTVGRLQFKSEIAFPRNTGSCL